MAPYESSRSQELRSNPEDEESRRDSHDLSLANARHRESLLDNLLLSFDKIGDGIGPFGGPESSPFFSPVDEVDDSASLYSRHSPGARNGSVGAAATGYNLQYPQRVRADQDLGYEHEGGSFGVTYGSSDREVRSRAGLGLDSPRGRGYSNAFEYDSAPAPSIRTRNRTPSPPRSPRLVRRPSNRSIKSLNQTQTFQPPEHFALPPLPAFASPPPQVASPMATPPKASRPGFFRRVFGGGSSTSAGSSSTPKTPTSTSGGNPPSTPPAHGPMNDPLPPPPPLQQVITKKSSFFRRRKKSVSDASQHPMPPPPLLGPVMTDAPSNADLDEPRTSSLRNAMKPYIPSPAWNHDSHHDLRSPSFPAQNATIRTVASSEALSTPQQSSYYGDGPWNQNGMYGSATDNAENKYKGDIWNDQSGTTNGESSPLGMDHGDRPFSSPQPSVSHNRTFYEDYDDDEREYMWPEPVIQMGRSTGRGSDYGRPQKSRQQSSDSYKDFAIMDMRDYERQYMKPEAAKEKGPERGEVQGEEQEKGRESQRTDDKETDREKKSQELNLDTRVRAPRTGIDQSWFLSTASPLTAITPTVTLQRDGQHSVVLDHDEHENSREDSDNESLKEGEFTEKDLDMAQKIYNGDEEFMAKEKAAAWLGDPGPDRLNIRKAYMSLHDWSGMNILAALRGFCGRLVFKGEAQQVDRIMDEISQRWCQCNPNHGFKNSDIVHTILYSILLLNTDLHMAEIPTSQRMTRGQFLKNTMSTIRRVLEDSPPELNLVKSRTRDGDERLGSSGTRSPGPFQPDDDDDAQLSALQSLTFPMPASHKSHSKRPSLEFVRGNRMSRIGNLSPRLLSDDNDKDLEMDGAVALVRGPISGGIKVWETQVEIVLKDFYQSIKAQALPLHGSTDVATTTPNNSLSVFGTGSMLRRTPSTISKAPSELSVTGRQREMGGKSSKDWSVRSRSRQRVYNGSFAGSSRTSLEERSSMWSQSASSTWSKYSLNKTQTSMSVDSLGSVFTQGDYQQSIGFANALSHAIIREEVASGHSGEEDLDVLLDGDDELELAGAPWAKEGLLKHKHHLEGVDKRAKNRNWTESFAVIQRGYMRLFQFPSRGSSKSNNQAMHGVVGGGNWTENAEPIGSFLLRQTIASALPPPGYSKTKPHVWALSLPSGAVHFFEVGTADIVKEFVTTANYWSARLSKEPLIGGVSNVEYGWSENIIDFESLALGVSSPPQSRNSDFPPSRPSLQISIRSSMDQSGGLRPRLPGDKVIIKDWSPPTQSMVASNLKESDQLRALESYVANIEADLTRHNELRGALMLAFSPRHPNYTRALNNWEQKSKYLLKEIIKFRTYIETLQSAIAKRQVISAEKLKVPSLPGDEESKKIEQRCPDVIPEYEDPAPKLRKVIT